MKRCGLMMQTTGDTEAEILLIEDDRFFQNVVAEAVKGIGGRFRLRVMRTGKELHQFMTDDQPDPKLALPAVQPIRRSAAVPPALEALRADQRRDHHQPQLQSKRPVLAVLRRMMHHG